MAFVWTPEPSEPLYTGSESLTSPLIFNISVADDPESPNPTPPVIKTVSIPPNVPDITYTGLNTSSITLTVAGFGLLYPIEIKTVDFETQVITTRTDFTLPVGSKITSYTKDTNSPRTLTIGVTAGTETAQYTLIVSADYSSNLSSFLQAVQQSY